MFIKQAAISSGASFLSSPLTRSDMISPSACLKYSFILSIVVRPMFSKCALRSSFLCFLLRRTRLTERYSRRIWLLLFLSLAFSPGSKILTPKSSIRLQSASLLITDQPIEPIPISIPITYFITKSPPLDKSLKCDIIKKNSEIDVQVYQYPSVNYLIVQIYQYPSTALR